jgi:hypothetical protein
MNGQTRRAFVAGCGAALGVSGCAHMRAPSASYQILRDDGEPLRSAFNAAGGSVRIVALVSPT